MDADDNGAAVVLGAADSTRCVELGLVELAETAGL